MSWEAALARVERLKIMGVWPGIILLADGTCELTCDPGDEPRPVNHRRPR